MMKRMSLSLFLLFLTAPLSSATAQQSQDFMAGRLFQVALEVVPEFTSAGAPSFGSLATGATQSFEQTLAAGTCYTWLAVGDTGQADLDLSVTVNGTQVASDDALDDWPIAQYCSATPATARVDLLMYSGSGAYAFNTYSRHFGGSDQIELQMNFLASMYAQGHVPQGPITRGTLTTGAEQTYPLPLSGGQCYTIIGTGGPGVTDLDLFLTDMSGTVVASDQAVDNFPIVGACPPANGNYTLRVLMYDGAGDFGWQLFQASF